MPGETNTLSTSHTPQTFAKPRENMRDTSLDIAKGIGIVLVVLGHCLDGLVASGFFPGNHDVAAYTVYLIYLFHMPLFFVVSGHLASGKHRPVHSTLAKLLPTIVYPYFLWSILEGLTMVLLGRFTNGHAQISSLFKILWIPIVPYWFLYSLFFCHLGFLAIRRFSPRLQLGIAVVIFLLLQPAVPTLETTHFTIVADTVRGFLYFILGAVSVTLVRRFGLRTAVWSSILYALTAVGLSMSPFWGEVFSPAWVPSGVAGIVATLAWSRMLAVGRSRVTDCLAFCGRYSMSIYVMHIFFTSGVRIALRHLAVEFAHQGPAPFAIATIVEIAGGTALGVALPLGVNWAVSRFSLDKWFGLQHMETN